MGQCCSGCCNQNMRGEYAAGEMSAMNQEDKMSRHMEIQSQTFARAPGAEGDSAVILRGNTKHVSGTSAKQDLKEEVKMNSHPSDRNQEKKLSQISNFSQRLNSEEPNAENKSSFNMASTKLHLLESRKVDNPMPFHDDLSQPKVDLVRAYRPNEKSENVRFYTTDPTHHYHISDMENYANDLPL